MADTKVTALTELTTGADNSTDVLPMVDISDTSMNASGTTKKIKPVNLLQTMRSTSLPAPAGLVASTSSGPGGNVGRLATNTYYYVYTAVDGDGNEFAKSSEASVAVTGPTGWVIMTLNPSVPSSQVSNNVPGAYEYRLYRGTSTGAQDRYIVVRNNTSARDYGDAGEETVAAPPSSGTLYDNALRRNGGGWLSGKQLIVNQEWTTGAVNISAGIESFVSSKQAGRVSDGHAGIKSTVRDRNDVTTKTITGAANNGSGLVRITATSHGFANGDRVSIYGITGSVNTAAHGLWTISNVAANTFDLVGSIFAGSYTSGGTAANNGLLYGVLSVVEPNVDRDQFVSPNLNGDDVVGLCVVNNGSARATEGVYIGHNGNMANAFGHGVAIDAPATNGFALGARTFTTGLNMTTATLTTGIDMSSSSISGNYIKTPTGGLWSSTGIKHGTSAGFLNGTKGAVFRTDDGSTVELFLDSQTASSALCYFSLRGRSSSVDVRGEMYAGGGFNAVGFQTATNHAFLIGTNGTTRMVVNADGGIQIPYTSGGKLAFFGGTPIVRTGAFTQTYSTATHTHPNATAVSAPAGGTGTAAGGYDTAANRNLMITSHNALITDVANLKQVVNGIIDDLQSYGLFQ